MTFIVGAIIGTVGVVAGATIASRGAKKAGEIAAGGADKEIEFARESRDLARGDVAPYREAGYTALDALMSMTGLKGTGSRAPVSNLGSGGVRASDYFAGVPTSGGGGSDIRQQRRGGSAYRLKYAGGPIDGREHGGTLYNVNELGAESVYQDGSYTRSNLPQTIPPNPTGYVAPNIQGRVYGGSVPYQPPPNIMNPPQFEPDVNVGPDITDPGPGKQNTADFYGDSYFNRPPKYGDSTGEGFMQPPSGALSNLSPFPNQSTGFGLGTGGGTTIDNNTGLPVNGAPRENPGGVEGGYNFMTDPGYNFRIGEGERALERSAAARGGLLSGGYGRRLTRYAQDYASNEYTNVYNRISNIAGLGQVSAQGSGNAALYAGQQMGAAAQAGANASAGGVQGQYNAWGNAANQIAQIDWGNVFKRGQTTTMPPAGMGSQNQGGYGGIYT